MTHSQQITFVSAYYTIYENPFLHRTKNWRFDRFREICQTGIPICIFCETESLNELQEIAYLCPNLYIMNFPQGLAGTEIWKMTKSNANYRMPTTSREGKDTIDYFILMNAKAEFVARVIQMNPFHTDKFAWMDFNLSHVFRNVESSTNYMKTIASTQYNEPFLTFPGCWPKLERDDADIVIDHVHWRFCGGFFVGDAKSLTNFYEKYKAYYPPCLETYQAATWEVNFWAWLEKHTDWRPTWYSADHNDSIVKIPVDFLAKSLTTSSISPISPVIQNELMDGWMEIQGYYPGSIAYLHNTYNNRHIINIRYINYEILNDGVYYFPSGNSTIQTKNVFAELKREEEKEGCFAPRWSIKQIHCMTEDEIGLVSTSAKCMGLEDIRLFSTSDGNIRFSSNSVNYSNNGRNQMIEGVYDIENHSLKHAQIIQSPTDTWLEKNWIPLGDLTSMGADTYIYSWNPFRIGKVNHKTNRLEIITEIVMKHSLFDKFRGSSIFVPIEHFPNSLIGVVHLSEEGSPRRYYHALVLLDKQTMSPTQISELFCFEKRGIEFCIGFAVVEDEYHFWISRMDRNPTLWKVKQEFIKWSRNKIV